MGDYGVYTMMKYATTKKPELLDEALNSDNYCITLKKDGASYYWAKDLNGSVHLYKDSISKKTGTLVDKIENVPHMKAFAEQYFPNGSQLVIEVCYGKTSKDVNSIMLALPPKAIQRQNDSRLAKAYIFDITFWDNKSYHEKDFADRWAKIEEIFKELEMAPLWMEFAVPVYEDKTAVIADWLARGEEGGVLKMLHSTSKTSAAYHLREIGCTAARPMHTTFKIKSLETTDVVIMGVEMPSKAYSGKDPENYKYRDEDGNPVNRLWKLGYANAFVIGAYDDAGNLVKIGTVASGLDDEMRAAAAQYPEDFILTTIEIECMSKDNISKTFRHPRFLRTRPDKPAQSCLMSEVFL